MTRKILQNKLVRYIATGGTAYVIEIVIIYLLIAAGLDKITAVGIAFWVGLAISFVLQKLIAFNNHEKTYKRLAHQSIAYGVLVGINYVFTLVFVSIFTPLMGVFIARTIALFITTLWNFFAYSKIIFKQNKQ